MSKLYVGNLSYNTTEETLREKFSAFGNVVSVNIIPGRGFGFVEMETTESAEAAKNGLNGTELDGRNIKVDNARPKKDFPRHGGERRNKGGFRRNR